MKIKTKRNGLPIAIVRVPVMYRLPDKFQAALRTAGSGKSHRQSSGPSTGEFQPEKPVEGAADTTAVLICFGGQ